MGVTFAHLLRLLIRAWRYIKTFQFRREIADIFSGRQLPSRRIEDLVDHQNHFVPEETSARTNSRTDFVADSGERSEQVADGGRHREEAGLPGLVRQKTVSPFLLSELGAAIQAVQVIGLDLGRGEAINPAPAVRKNYLANRAVVREGEKLIEVVKNTFKQLEDVGYTDDHVCRLLHQGEQSLHWLHPPQVQDMHVHGRQMLTSKLGAKVRIGKWCALHTSKMRGRVFASEGSESCVDRKSAQAELIARLQLASQSLLDSLQIGLAEAEDDLCHICMERPRTIVLQHSRHRLEERHQVCEQCYVHLSDTSARCPFCMEALVW